MVIGDDIESDIKGANNAGIYAVLVKTGKSSNFKITDNKSTCFPIINNFKAVLNKIQ